MALLSIYPSQMLASTEHKPYSFKGDTTHQMYRGNKRYEGNNHLGNILVVFTDKRLNQCVNDSVRYYQADVAAAYDYSPFGAPLPGRTWPAANYSVIDTGTCDKTLLSSNYNQATQSGNNVIDGELTWKPNSGSHTNLSLEGDGNGKSLKVSCESSAQRYALIEELVLENNKTHYLRFKLKRQGVTTVRVQLRKYNGSSYENHVQADVSADGQHSVALSTDGSSKFQVRILATTFGSGNYFTLDDFTLSKDSACQIYWSQDTGVYRFGFNGMEKDNELNGTSNSYDFGARIYDGRLGRWLSVDPRMSKYPSCSPYVFALNSPLTHIDPEGDTVRIYLSGNSIKPVLQINTPDANVDFTLPADFKLAAASIKPVEVNIASKFFDRDALILSIDAGFAFVGGATVGLAVARINTGKHAGTWAFYRQGGVTLGASLGFGGTLTAIDFNEQNRNRIKLSPDALKGKSQGHSVSIGISATTLTAYTDGNYCTNFDCGEVLYEGDGVGWGVGAKVGYQYYFTDSSIIGIVSQANQRQSTSPTKTKESKP